MKSGEPGTVFPDYGSGVSAGRGNSTILRIGIGEL